MSLHPSDGARFLLELDEQGPDGARYRASIYAPAARADFTIAFSPNGDTTIDPIGEPAPLPPGAPEMLRAIARSVARSALAASPPDWPRRVLRWRKLTR